MNELWNCQRKTTGQFPLDTEMLLQVECLDLGCKSLLGVNPQICTKICAIASIPAEEAVPCLTCCCGLADSEWHHAGRFDVDGTQEVCRVNGDVKRRVTEVHRSGSLT